MAGPTTISPTSEDVHVWNSADGSSVGISEGGVMVSDMYINLPIGGWNKL